jgi:hypothetical protein
VSCRGGVVGGGVVGIFRVFLWESYPFYFQFYLISNENDYQLQKSILKMILNSNDNENHFHLKAFSDF